jgi:hypothetical protein
MKLAQQPLGPQRITRSTHLHEKHIGWRLTFYEIGSYLRDQAGCPARSLNDAGGRVAPSPVKVLGYGSRRHLHPIGDLSFPQLVLLYELFSYRPPQRRKDVLDHDHARRLQCSTIRLSEARLISLTPLKKLTPLKLIDSNNPRNR